MEFSVWWQADERGYRVIVKQGIRVCGKARFDNPPEPNAFSVPYLVHQAKQEAAKLAHEKQSIEQPVVKVHQGKDLFDE